MIQSAAEGAAREYFIVPPGVTELVRGMDVDALIESRSKTAEWQKINVIDRALAELPQAEMPLHHVFCPGSYCRSIFMPAGTLLTTRIHLTEHPFVISAGVVSVWSDEHGWEVLRASHVGVTKAGTRRILYIHEPCVWTTFHANPSNETDPDKLVDALTFNPTEFGHFDDLPPDKFAAIQANAKTRRALP